MRIRVVWKDTIVKTDRKPVKYRNYIVSGCETGWVVSINGDNNIYKTHYDAKNAIDKALGTEGRVIGAKRKRCGIRIVGTKDDIV